MIAVRNVLGADTEVAQSILDTMSEDDFEDFIELQNSITSGDELFETLMDDKINDIRDEREQKKYIQKFIHFYLNIQGPSSLFDVYLKKSEQLKDAYEEKRQSLDETVGTFTDIVKNTMDDIVWFLSIIPKMFRDDDEMQTGIRLIYNSEGNLLVTYNEEKKDFDFNWQVTNILMPLILNHIQKNNVRRSGNNTPVPSSLPQNYEDLKMKVATSKKRSSKDDSDYDYRGTTNETYRKLFGNTLKARKLLLDEHYNQRERNSLHLYHPHYPKIMRI